MRTAILQWLFIGTVIGVLLWLRYLTIDRPALRQKFVPIYFLQTIKASSQAIKTLVPHRNVANWCTWLIALLVLTSSLVWLAPDAPAPFYPYGRFIVASWHTPQRTTSHPPANPSAPPHVYGRFGIVRIDNRTAQN